MKGTVKAARLSLPDRWLRYLSYGLIHLVHRPKICGPKPVLDKPTIFACRHLGLMDPVILMVVYFRMMVRPLVAKDYYEANKFTRSFYKHAQCIPLDRKRSQSKQWIEDSLSALEKGESIIIFPEGKRNKSKVGLLPFHGGVTLLAAKSSAQIIPVYNGVWKFPHRYRLAIGEPFHIAPVPADGINDKWLASQTAVIQEAVAALAPRVE